MANEPPPNSDDQELLDELFATANPNPSRARCPTHETLMALALRERRPGDPAYEHLGECSECYRQVRAYQLARSRRRIVAALVAVVALLIVGAWYGASVTLSPMQPSVQRKVDPPAIRVQLDLRDYRVARTEEKRAPTAPLELARQRLRVRIILPVGSDVGAYDLHVLDSELRPAASATGIATIEHHATVLDTLLDLRSLAPGAYQLALRRHGESWHLYPARLA